MYWHIDTDIIGLLVICALYGYTMKMLPTDELTGRNRSFMWCLRCGILMTVVDIAASVAMEAQTTRLIYQALMTLYLLVVELVIVSWFLYALSILYHGDARGRRRAVVAVAAPYMVYALLVLTNPWTELFFSLGPNMEYAREAMFLPIMVGLFLAYALALLLLIVVRRRHIPDGYPWSVLFITPLILGLAIPAQLLNEGWLMLMPAYMLCLVLAFLFFQNSRVRNERAQLKQLAELVEHFASGVAISEIDRERRVKVAYASSGYAEIFGDDPQTLMEQYGRDLFTGIHPQDRERVQASVERLLKEGTNEDLTYRYITSAGDLKWIQAKIELVRHADGTATSYSTYTDLTEQRRVQQRLDDIIQTVPCGICLYRWDGERLSPLLANARLSEMLGVDAMNHLESIGGLDYRYVHPEDAQSLKQASMEALLKTRRIDVTFRMMNPQVGEYVWVRENGILVPQPDGTQLVYVSYFDVTQEHKIERQLRESEQALEYATLQAGLSYWRYDPMTDRTYPDERNQREYGVPPVMENSLTEWINKDIVHPDYIDAYRDACQRIKEGERQVVLEALGYAGDKSLHWYRYCLTNLYDEKGNATIAVGTSMNIDSERELRAKYELERKRSAIADETLLVHAVFNLTTGETLEYQYRDGAPVPSDKRDAFAYSRENAHLLIDPEERERFIALNDQEKLLERFARGETEFRLDYRRQLSEGGVGWVRSSLHLVRDPQSGDILLFEYWHDIEEEKMLEWMYRSIASDNYDYVARINGKTKSFVVFPKAGLTYHMPPMKGDDADAFTMNAYGECIVHEDRDMVIHNMLMNQIREHLQESGRFQFTYREKQPDGSIRYKKITQYYIDAQREIIAMMREDVTELIREETDKNRMLAEALDAANQASIAKSAFLSRVSHELRTPLNAIIGFMDLAKDADAGQVQSYLANADIAAKQLLSIINDVLDMSAIESGKMKIAHVPFDFKHLIQSLTNLFVLQCRQKGLAYETKLTTAVDEWLVGDRLRVNQVLLNLMSNAVKFTTSGHVWLTVRQHEGQNGRVFIRFEVSDTGCGMTEDMRARLFRPFEQESAETAQKYGGNGLGLSIVGSLVKMMGGAIQVESRLGEGSTFIVDLPFIRSEVHEELQTLEGLEGIRALVVDDEAAEREYISTVLQRIGVRHACVENGSAALMELASVHDGKDPYNICLVDWKMPDMNGLETVRRIREKYGDHLIVIVVSAYEHYQADESVRAAGGNVFISKPLFQSSLFDLFATLTNGRVVRKECTPTGYDFIGRRVLLAEDNTMNRVIAENLLQKRFGIACECAEDGRIALDMFLAAEPGYYDAILMDIQMPNMDGYEAARAIRASAHPDAKSIQMIALTANAFNEDIARSLSNGMNGHVAKPVDPGVLADALHSAFLHVPMKDREPGEQG